MNRTICFIPVRKGSKGIPNKNIRKLGGKPLVCWVLDTLLASSIADVIWVATDSDQMESLITRRYNHKVKVFRRSEESATDTSPTIEVVKEFIRIEAPDDNDRFVLLQATSPFTSVADLQTLHRDMQEQGFDSYISCCRTKKFRWSEDGHPLDYTFDNKPRRQTYKGALVETGAFYATAIRHIKKTGQLVSGKIKVVETGNNGMIDIDDEEDWAMAEGYLKIAKTHQPNNKIYSQYSPELWRKALSPLSGQLLFYIQDDALFNSLQPIVNSLNRPVLLLCEQEVDTGRKMESHVSTVRMCYTGDIESSFNLFLEGLNPEGIVLTDDKSPQGAVLRNLASQKNIPLVIIEECNPENLVAIINDIVPCHYLKTSLTPSLHIGCGSFSFDGWLNTDIVRYRKDVYYLDAGKTFPFPNDSFQYIYSEHLFEHLDYMQGTNMLQECYRILKKGGKMRLAMPDFHFLMNLYLNPKEETNEKYLEWSFQHFASKYIPHKVSTENLPTYVINHFFRAWGHQFIHTPEELTEKLEMTGFKNIHRFPIGESETPAFKSIERHQDKIPEWANRLETFVIEMEKA